MTKKQLIINKIQFIRPNSLAGQGRFLLNAASQNEIWVNPSFIANALSGLGLDPKGTPFQFLKGSVLVYWEHEITEEMLQTAGGEVTVKSPRGRDITFKTAGKKVIDQTLEHISQQMENAINALGVSIDSGWMDTATPRPTTVQTPAPEKVDMNNTEEPLVEEVDALQDQAPGEELTND